MKRLLLILCLLGSPHAFPQARNTLDRLDEEEGPLPEGPELMEQVRAQLPPMPLRLTGKIRTREKKEIQDRRLVSELRFGDAVPSATYTLSDAFGDLLTRMQVRWPSGKAEFKQWDNNAQPLPPPAPGDEVADTGLTWSDLSLDFLWWPGAVVQNRDQVKSRSAVVLTIPAPPARKDVHHVKLWVDERALFIVRAELLDKEGELLKRIEVDSLKKVRDDLWMVKDLEIYDRVSRRHIGIRFEDVVEMEDGE